MNDYRQFVRGLETPTASAEIEQLKMECDDATRDFSAALDDERRLSKEHREAQVKLNAAENARARAFRAYGKILGFPVRYLSILVDDE